MAVKTIALSHQAAEELDALRVDVWVEISRALDIYAMLGRGDIKALNGRAGYRLRVGRYRVIFNEDATTVLAITLGKRDATTDRT